MGEWRMAGRRWTRAAAIAAAAGLSCAGLSPATAGEIDDGVIAELNFARTRPQEYARRLMGEPASGWETALAGAAGRHDAAAFKEAVDFLMRQPPLQPLRPDATLRAAAADHAAAQGATGATGHTGTGGERFDARLRRHGLKAELAGEAIAYGPPTARDLVRELIIDSGVADRGHRRNIFRPEFATAGVGCGPHRSYGAICVIDFASETARR